MPDTYFSQGAQFNLGPEAVPNELEAELPPACSTDDHESQLDANDARVASLIELILKHRAGLDRLIRKQITQSHLVPRFLGIALASFVLYGIAMTLVFSAAAVWPSLASPLAILRGESQWPLVFVPTSPDVPLWRPWLDGSAWTLIAAYALGLIAASGICLPSLYFYGLLAGVRMSMLDVVLHTLKSKATAAVALIGLLPIYAALALGIAIFPAPTEVRHVVFWLGLILPFVAGLWGTWSLYRGFVRLSDTLPDSCRDRRHCFLRRLVVAWALCYSAVTPVLIFTLWQRLS